MEVAVGVHENRLNNVRLRCDDANIGINIKLSAKLWASQTEASGVDNASTE